MFSKHLIGGQAQACLCDSMFDNQIKHNLLFHLRQLVKM